MKPDNVDGTQSGDTESTDREISDGPVSIGGGIL